MAKKKSELERPGRLREGLVKELSRETKEGEEFYKKFGKKPTASRNRPKSKKTLKDRTTIKEGKRTTFSVSTDGKRKSTSIKGPDTLQTDLKGMKIDKIISPTVKGLKKSTREVKKVVSEGAKKVYSKGKKIVAKGKEYVQKRAKKQGSSARKYHNNTYTEGQ